MKIKGTEKVSSVKGLAFSVPFRIQGILEFSLIGILSKISKILAENEIGIFAISTFNTDYVLTKKENYQKAIQTLADAGYKIVK